MANIKSSDARKPGIVAAFKALVPECRKVTELRVNAAGVFTANCLGYGVPPGLRGKDIDGSDVGYWTIGARSLALKSPHAGYHGGDTETGATCPPGCFELVSGSYPFLPVSAAE